MEHEAAYVAHLAAQGLTIVDLSGPNERHSAEGTLAAMAAGVDVIVQGALQDGLWFGRPDVLRKTVGPSRLAIGFMSRMIASSLAKQRALRFCS